MKLRTTYGPAQIYKSLLRFCDGLCTNAPHALEYYAWDSRNEEAELPRRDLVGISGWTYQDDEALLTVSFGLTVSTIEDINLMREIELLDYLHEIAGKGSTIPVLDMVSGLAINELAVSSFNILPTGQSLLRNYRTAALELALTRPSDG